MMKVHKIRRGVIIPPQLLVTIVVEEDGEDDLVVFTVDEQNMKFIAEKQVVETKAPEPLPGNPGSDKIMEPVGVGVVTKSTEDSYFYGYQAICAECRHRNDEMVRLSHVNPCGRVRWEGHKHFLPDCQDGWCSDFQSPEAAAREEEEA